MAVAELLNDERQMTAESDMSPLQVPTDWQAFRDFRGRRFVFFAGHFDFFSGAERQAVYFAGELVRQLDADVTFVGWGGDGRLAEEARGVGARIVVQPLDIGLPRWSDRYQLLKLAGMLRQQLRPDFILPYVWMHCRAVGAIWRLTGAKFCWWNQRDEGRGIQGSWLERRLMKTLPAVVSNSWEGRDFLTSRFQLPPGRVEVINNGIQLPEPGRDLTWRQSVGICPDAFLISMLANLTVYKDHLTLLRAFAEAQRLCPGQNLQLILAGSHCETAATIKALAWDLGLQGHLHLPGPVSDIMGLLRATDLVVHSSLTEGCPNGVLEPMALGLPVLGTDISGLRQALGESMAGRSLSPPNDWQKLGWLISRQVACR
ncbi:MAG: glycosyltransferase family 4 protein, partial [Planctomycetaceae bacterium]